MEPLGPQLPLPPEPARIARVALLMDAEYYWSRAAAVIGPSQAEDAAVHYLRQGAALGLSPNPAFDDAFYRAQLPNSLPAETTPLEHYVESGADAGLDPSPMFSTREYLRIHADVAATKVNPLWHFLRWGAAEGRQPMPDDLPDREARINQVLARDPSNRLALRMLGEMRFRQSRLDEALDAFERAERSGAMDAAGRVFKGEALLRLGAVDQAIPILKQALVDAPFLRDALPIYLLYAAGERELATAILSAQTSRFDDCQTVIDAPLSSVRSTCLEEKFQYRELLPERPIEPVKLRFAEELPRPIGRPGILTAPAFYFAALEDCIALPKCNLLMHRNRAIYDLAAHELGDIAILGEHFRKRRIIRGRSATGVLLGWPADAPVEQGQGLMMFGFQTANYGHWCLEFLPRMLAFDRQDCGDAWPIIVDAGMPPTHLEALALLNSRGRAVIQIADDRPLRFERLGVAPVPTFFPCDTVPAGQYDAIWPSDVLGDLSRRMLQTLGLTTEAWPAPTGRRLFVARKGFNQRQMLNEAEIEELFARQGFETVSPEKLSFEEQVRLFHSASIIAGSCSSGLTSALFCRPGTRLVGLIHDQPEFNYGGYTSFLRAAGAEIQFVRGKTALEPLHHPYHRSYTINPGQITEPLKWAERRS